MFVPTKTEGFTKAEMDELKLKYNLTPAGLNQICSSNSKNLDDFRKQAANAAEAAKEAAEVQAAAEKKAKLMAKDAAEKAASAETRAEKEKAARQAKKAAADREAADEKAAEEKNKKAAAEAVAKKADGVYGKTLKEVKASLEPFSKKFNIEYLETGTSVTKEFNPRRIRVFHDSKGVNDITLG